MDEKILKKSSINKNLRKNYISLFFWIIAFQCVAFFLGKMTQHNISDWYHALAKSSLNPPDFIFPIVWGFLYIVLAVVGWHLYGQRTKAIGNSIFNSYAAQMVMNWLWTPLFFEWHLIGLSFFWIIGIIFLLIVTIFQCLKNFKLTAVLLSPYLFWLIFASYLNYFIWIHN
ncbi:MAG: tryptophan-rich sensory protein [Gammaproteobacteria bacterium]|nr:tryptophan-rich sensory protein [Gammaproteobacteria bacterium]